MSGWCWSEILRRHHWFDDVKITNGEAMLVTLRSRTANYSPACVSTENHRNPTSRFSCFINIQKLVQMTWFYSAVLWNAEKMPLKSRTLRNWIFLSQSDTSSMTRFQIDQLMYSAVAVMNQLMHLETSLQVTVLIDSFMSNFFRVYHQKPSDRTVLDKMTLWFNV